MDSTWVAKGQAKRKGVQRNKPRTRSLWTLGRHIEPRKEKGKPAGGKKELWSGQCISASLPSFLCHKVDTMACRGGERVANIESPLRCGIRCSSIDGG